MTGQRNLIVTGANGFVAGSVLAQADAESPYSLEFRVSLDGFTATLNDPVRGPGTFDRALKGVLVFTDFHHPHRAKRGATAR